MNVFIFLFEITFKIVVIADFEEAFNETRIENLNNRPEQTQEAFNETRIENLNNRPEQTEETQPPRAVRSELFFNLSIENYFSLVSFQGKTGFIDGLIDR